MKRNFALTGRVRIDKKDVEYEFGEHEGKHSIKLKINLKKYLDARPDMKNGKIFVDCTNRFATDSFNLGMVKDYDEEFKTQILHEIVKEQKISRIRLKIVEPETHKLLGLAELSGSKKTNSFINFKIVEMAELFKAEIEDDEIIFKINKKVEKTSIDLIIPLLAEACFKESLFRLKDQHNKYKEMDHPLLDLAGKLDPLKGRDIDDEWIDGVTKKFSEKYKISKNLNSVLQKELKND